MDKQVVKLTDSQKELATLNHNLIYGYLHKNKLDIEEWYALAAIGYCKGIATYNNDKNISLASYVYKCMDNECKSVFRDTGRVKRKSNVENLSLEGILTNYWGEYYIDKNLPYVDETEYIALQIDISNAIVKIKPQHQLIIKLKLAGYSQRAISRYTGISQATCANVIRKFQRYLEEKVK